MVIAFTYGAILLALIRKILSSLGRQTGGISEESSGAEETSQPLGKVRVPSCKLQSEVEWVPCQIDDEQPIVGAGSHTARF